MGPTWGPVPRWAPCWPHEPCYQGWHDISQDFVSHCEWRQQVNEKSKPLPNQSNLKEYFSYLNCQHCSRGCPRIVRCQHICSHSDQGEQITARLPYMCDRHLEGQHIEAKTIWPPFATRRFHMDFPFQLNFHWSLFIWVQLTIFHHWFR